MIFVGDMKATTYWFIGAVCGITLIVSPLIMLGFNYSNLQPKFPVDCKSIHHSWIFFKHTLMHFVLSSASFCYVLKNSNAVYVVHLR